LGLAAVLCVSLAKGVAAEERTLSMYNIHTKEEITVTFKKDGKYIPDGLKKLNHFMRDWRKNIEIAIDPALLDLIWELHEELGSKQPIHLICGHRSSGTNEMLRRTSGGQAKNSRHITGQAADLMFPDVPIKQLRYSALVRERGGVGYYPGSGIPFVHLDTGNVRHWPRISRTELAAIYPNGHSKHIPADGRPVTKEDYKVAVAKLKADGQELPWIITGQRANAKTMLASLTPTATPPVLQRASLGSATANAPAPYAPPPATPVPNDQEAAYTEEGEEQDDEIAFEPLPAAFLLTENPLSFEDIRDGDLAKPASASKLAFLLSPPSAIVSSELDELRPVETALAGKRTLAPSFSLLAWKKARPAQAEQVASLALARAQ
jgi:uncharacterized protein YcbK (DUF882 family)